MRIGLDANEANIKERVGSNTYAFEVLTRLPEFGSKHQYKIFLKDPPLSDLPKKANITYEVVKPKPYWTQFALPLKLFFEKSIDVFYSSSHYAPRYCSIPLVLTIYDLSFEKFPEYFKPSDLIKLKNWTAYSVKKANHIITISEYSKKDIVNFYGIPENKVTVAYPGFNKDVYKITKEKLEIDKVKQKFNIHDRYIIYIGTLQPRKNLPALLIALTKLKNINLVIVGKKGWLFNSIFKKVKELGLGNRVIFTDFIEAEEISTLLNGAECFVLPSLYEGFGIPVLEAFGCGCPVAASNTSSLPEIIGDAGVLFDPNNPDDIANSLEKILGDVKYKQALVENGLKRQKAFDWGTCTQTILRTIEGVKNAKR